MSKITIPQKFLDVAATHNIPADIATAYYLAKIAKQSTDSAKILMVKENLVASEDEAKAVLIKAWKEYNKLATVDSTTPPPVAQIAYNTYLEKATAQLDKLIGKLPAQVKNTANNNKKRIAVAGDFHFPFAHEKGMAQLLQDPADTLFIMGDFMDMYAASRHRQTTDRIRVLDELSVAKAYLAKLSAKFSKIYMIAGNHDNRSKKKIQDLAPELIPLIISPLDLISRDFDNIEIMKTPVNNTASLVAGDVNHEMDYVGIINDCLFGHFENFCGLEAPRKVERWISEWNHVLQLNDIKVIFQAHTHRLQAEFTSQGRLLVGTGCMSNPQPYQFENHGKYAPPVVGYVSIEQDENGKTDFSSLQMHYIGVN